MSKFLGKWGYSHDEENFHGDFDTPEDALEEAEAMDDTVDTIFVAPCAPFLPATAVNADMALDALRDAAGEHAGEHAEGWLSGLSKEAVQELDECLVSAVELWIQKHKLEPHFYGIDHDNLRCYDKQEDGTYKLREPAAQVQENGGSPDVLQPT